MRVAHKLNAVVWALASFVVLYQSALDWQQFIVVLFSVVLLMTAANLLVFRKFFRKGAEITILLLPVFWLGAGSFFVWLSSYGGVQSLLALFCAAVLFLLEDRLDRLSVQLFELVFFLSATGLILGIWALDYYFTPGWWIIMTLIFITSFTLLLLGFRALPVSFAEKTFFSLVLGLALTEISWTMLFWPLHFFSNGAAFMGIFYAVWMTARLVLSRAIGLKQVLFNLVLVGLLEILVLTSAVWLPVT